MKARSKQQRRESLEAVAEEVHRSLTRAKELVERRETMMAFLLARQNWPLAVWCADRRWQEGGIKTTGATRRTTKVCIERIRETAMLPEWEGNDLAIIDLRATTDWGTPDEAESIIDAGLRLLEASESKGRRRRRETPQQDVKPSRLRRWAAAAAGLFAAGGAS